MMITTRTNCSCLYALHCMLRYYFGYSVCCKREHFSGCWYQSKLFLSAPVMGQIPDGSAPNCGFGSGTVDVLHAYMLLCACVQRPTTGGLGLNTLLDDPFFNSFGSFGALTAMPRLGEMLGPVASGGLMKMDVKESDSAIEVRCDVPGFTKVRALAGLAFKSGQNQLVRSRTQAGDLLSKWKACHRL